jgi:hypothetical protein
VISIWCSSEFLNYFTELPLEQQTIDKLNLLLIKNLLNRLLKLISLKTYTQPDPKTQTIARTFSYSTFALLIGAMIYLMTNNLISLTLRPDWFGTIALAGFGLVYGNVSYFVARRYMRKLYTFSKFPFVVGVIMILPAFTLVRIKQDVFFDIAAEVSFMLVILIGSLFGAHLGIKKGKVMLIDDQERRKIKTEEQLNR